MAVKIDELKNIKFEDVLANPELQNLQVFKDYGLLQGVLRQKQEIATIDPNKMTSLNGVQISEKTMREQRLNDVYIPQARRDFSRVVNNYIEGIRRQSFGSQVLTDAADLVLNAGDNARITQGRQAGLAELNRLKDMYAGQGIDITSSPDYQKYQSIFSGSGQYQLDANGKIISMDEYNQAQQQPKQEGTNVQGQPNSTNPTFQAAFKKYQDQGYNYADAYKMAENDTTASQNAAKPIGQQALSQIDKPIDSSKLGKSKSIEEVLIGGQDYKIINTDMLNWLAKKGLKESDIRRENGDIYIKADSEFAKNMSPLEAEQIQLEEEKKKNETINNQDVSSNISQTATQNITGETILDKYTNLVDNFFANKQEIKSEAESNEQINTLKNEVNKAQAQANEILNTIEKMRSDVDLQDILNEETKIALENKLKGETIPMGVINNQLTKELSNLDQKQRIERLYDIYALNTQINEYNALLRNVELLNSQYQAAQERVQQTIDDWTEWQNMKLNLLEITNQIQSEERDRLQKEINYQRELALNGYTPIDNVEIYNNIVKDLGITAGNYSQFIYKDPASGKMYLRPQETQTADINDFQKSQLITQFMGHGYDFATALQKANQVVSGVGFVTGQATGTTPYLPETQAPAGGFRTDRHNNPTAFTTDVAQTAGLIEGVDYVQGDSFIGGDGQTYYTARLLGDPIQTTIDVINNIGFFTDSGNQRWSHTVMADEVWHSMDNAQKRAVVDLMYRREGGSGSLVGAATEPTKQYDNLTPNQAKDINKEIATSDAFKGLKAGQDSIDLLKNYKDLVEENGLQVFGKKSQQQESAYQALLLNLKELFNLGVLNGPDLTLMESIIPKTTNVWTNIGKLVTGKGKDSAIAGINEAAEILERQIELKYNDLISQYGNYNPEQLNNLNRVKDRYKQIKNKLSEFKSSVGETTGQTSSGINYTIE